MSTSKTLAVLFLLNFCFNPGIARALSLEVNGNMGESHDGLFSSKGHSYGAAFKLRLFWLFDTKIGHSRSFKHTEGYFHFPTDAANPYKEYTEDTYSEGETVNIGISSPTYFGFTLRVFGGVRTLRIFRQMEYEDTVSEYDEELCAKKNPCTDYGASLTFKADLKLAAVGLRYSIRPGYVLAPDPDAKPEQKLNSQLMATAAVSLF